MNTGKTVFTQLMNFVSKTYFDKLVKTYKGNYRIRTFSCWDQFLSMVFAQLSYRESLRDIEVCLRSNSEKLYHMGIKGNISRTNLARANENRNWMIFEKFAHSLIHQALTLYGKDELIFKELDNTLYALDSTTIDLCLTLFPWARFRKQKSAIKINTLLDIRTSLPIFINITSGSVHEVNSLDLIPIKPTSVYVMDKGFIDFERLYSLNLQKAFFITRSKINLVYRRIYSSNISEYENIICDQIIKLTGPLTSKLYPEKLRRVKFFDKENNKRLTFITNNLTIDPTTIAALYKERWKIELFFKWIKQHLRIKSFYGTSENAIKVQIWIAISTYVLIAIIKKKLQLNENLYTILQILSVNVFNKLLLKELFTKSNNLNPISRSDKQLFLFNF
jgi:hypothetical protein